MVSGTRSPNGTLKPAEEFRSPASKNTSEITKPKERLAIGYVGGGGVARRGIKLLLLPALLAFLSKYEQTTK